MTTHTQRKIASGQKALTRQLDQKLEIGTAIVTAVTTSPSAVTLKLNGTSHTVAGVRYLDSYLTPTVNDVVRVAILGSDKFVIGRQKP